MPRYTYRCDSCDQYFDFSHSMNEKHTTCTSCEEDREELFYRVPSRPQIMVKKDHGQSSTTPGKIVKEFIENSKEDIREYKKELTKEVDYD